jgi:hypothetical protein
LNCTPQYAPAILTQIRQDDALLNPHSDLFRDQSEITPEIRAEFTEWIAKHVITLQNSSKPLFLAVKLLDRLLVAERFDDCNEFFLSGVCCLSLAMKLENHWYPQVQQYVEICQGSIKGERMIQRELEIMKILGHRINTTTAIIFVKMWLNEIQADAEMGMTAIFVGLCSLLSADLAVMNSELVGLAVLVVALGAAQGVAVREEIRDVIERFGSENVRKCAEIIVECVNQVINQKESAIRELFESPDRGCVATKLIYKVPQLN